MPNSLKARLKKLKYQGVLSQEDIDRIVILPNAEKVTENSTMMTNEEASKHLTAKLECLTRSKGFCEKCDSYNSYEGCYECDLGYKQGNIGEQIESLKSAIKALEKQEPCEDCISREDAIERFTHWYSNLLEYHKEEVDFKDILMDMPSVTPQSKTGHWITQDIHNCHTDFKCSECDYIHSFMHLYGEPTADYTYCPNCGARMLGGS